MNNPLKIVSLFDGISCGRVAFERVGIGVGAYSQFCKQEKSIRH